jgi:hypothetical protein
MKLYFMLIKKKHKCHTILLIDNCYYCSLHKYREKFVKSDEIEIFIIGFWIDILYKWI